MCNRDSQDKKEKRAGEDACATSEWHSRGYLPHLRVEGGTYFVTFRLADSLPREVVARYRSERENIVNKVAAGGGLTQVEEQRLARLFSERIEAYLDTGAGACWLRRPDIGRLVAQALRHFDGVRYHLHAWVVMPNHVHAVVTPFEGYQLRDILHTWKSYTAHEASRVLHRKGMAFWQRESYDHVIRDDADFVRLCEYTIYNPVQAHLCQTPEEWPFVSVAQAFSPAGGDGGGGKSKKAQKKDKKLKDAGGDACATGANNEKQGCRRGRLRYGRMVESMDIRKY